MRSRITLDRDHRILSADTETGVLEGHLGENLWDVFPGSVGLWERPMREAWDHGTAHSVNFYDGTLWGAWFSVADGTMAFEFEPMAVLDATNLGTAKASLDEILSLVEAEERRVAAEEHRRRSGGLEGDPELQRSHPD